VRGHAPVPFRNHSVIRFPAREFVCLADGLVDIRVGGHQRSLDEIEGWTGSKVVQGEWLESAVAGKERIASLAGNVLRAFGVYTQVLDHALLP